ncbi:pentapeptide repeat-containing protein [Nocardiopsis alba]|uniref:pentapeptide repeat-containing protein n=1 Tax=Nocardiopsis alba TaxID=53437 RepID=UPI0036B9481E
MRSLTPRQWTGIALTVVALPALTVAVWPLLVFLRELFPSGVSVGRGLVIASLVVIVAVAANLIRTRKQTSFRLWSLILTAWVVAIGAVAGMVVLIWLVLGTPGLDLPTALSPKALDAIGTRAFAVVAGLGGVALLVIHYRRQRTTEADADRAERAAAREVTKLFNERFTTAYTELGSEHAAVRLGAVYALAHLIDDAPSEEEAQMVIDVLCAYLRMPYEPRPDEPSGQSDQSGLPTTAVDLGQLRGIEPDVQREKQQEAKEEHQRKVLEFEASQQVRHTIIRIIGNRLREDTCWRGKNYDFTGVVFDGGDLTGAHFSGGTVSFDGARFSGGTMTFAMAQFSGGKVSFDDAWFSGGKVSFDDAWFSGGKVSFDDARFSGGKVSFDGAQFSNRMVTFIGAQLSGGKVSFDDAQFSGGTMAFAKAQFSGGEVSFIEAQFSGGEVSFGRARFSGGKVSFAKAQFSGGKVSFAGAQFSGGKVSFTRAEFKRGAVFFDGARFSGGTMAFAGARFSGGKVSFIEAQFSGGTMTFARAQFSGGTMHFIGARFSGGTTTFTKADFNDGKVDFGWAGFLGDLDDFKRARGACPAGLRKAREQATPGVLLYPAAWEHRSGDETSASEATTSSGS